MTLIRERRQQRALRLSVPEPVAPLWHCASSSSSPSSSGSMNSPVIENLSDLEKLAVLGHGNGGTVYKVRHRLTMEVYALKVIRFGEDAGGAAKVQQQATHEGEILKLVDSRFVVRCYGVLDSALDDGGDMYFVMEYMATGSLQDVLCARRRLSETTISLVARSVLEGLRYLHGIQIVHRDIKPSNLLINCRGAVKIADFGVSRIVADTIEECDSCVGTCAYMSPERVDPERWDGDYSDGFAADVWSLGVVVLECHVGCFPLIPPGQKADWATLVFGICLGEKMEMPESASPEFHDFFNKT
ncbi:hypothetical protein RJ639_000695 [Escallonia herrerae]|uniref:mitogen-activated protein kinase kinase n=1 Tax=Escallonia herrerae TaxID=1293975 RepID=A0AA88X8K3_9ASTE|nr:hypothetical protein RJ639_000695 [Escallonia herrerae]